MRLLTASKMKGLNSTRGNLPFFLMESDQEKKSQPSTIILGLWQMTSNEQQTVALPQKRPERGLIARGECSKGRRGIRVKGQEADRAI